MPISRANCLNVVSFRPAGIHLFGEGFPAQQGKAVGDYGILLVTFLGRTRKVTRPAGRDRPKLIFR
jgi:hypothetical protein